MTRRLATRAILASALLVPVVAGAGPGRLPQATEVAPIQSELSFTADPLDPRHARLIARSGDQTVSLDASSLNLTYTATGLVVDVKGPGGFTINGTTSPLSDLGTARLTFKDGKLVKMEQHEGGRHFACPPACAGGSSSGSD